MDNINSSFCKKISLNTAKTSVTKEEAEKLINQAFKSLAENIIPLKDGKETLQPIVNLLKKKSRFSIDRHVIVGSAGKKTTIMESDVDCVMFINDEEPPFKGVLEDFEAILQKSEIGYQIKKPSINTTECSIQFSASGFDFDILPARNFVKGLSFSGDKLITEQQRLTLNRIKENPDDNCYKYSSGVGEAAVKFIKERDGDGFVNDMVRICKFWYKTLQMPRYISGAKTLIELVAVHAVNAVMEEKTKSYLRCFSNFLELLDNFDELNISFEADPNHPANDIKKQQPLVLEPANPYNNLAKYWTESSKKDVLNFLKECVTETIRRVEAMNQKAASGGDVNLMKLFEQHQQPKFASHFPSL